jgi:hypothetical protein
VPTIRRDGKVCHGVLASGFVQPITESVGGVEVSPMKV